MLPTEALSWTLDEQQEFHLNFITKVIMLAGKKGEYV